MAESSRLPLNDLPIDIKTKHYQLYQELNGHIFPEGDGWSELILTRLPIYGLSKQKIQMFRNCMEVCTELEAKGLIYPGDYQVLIDIFTALNMADPVRIIKKYISMLEKLFSKHNLGGPKVTEKQQHLLDITHLRLKEWKKKRHIFVETRAYQRCKELLEKSNCVNIIGVNGSGKSSISEELLLRSRRRTIIIEGLDQLKDVVDLQGGDWVVLVEDIFGKFRSNNEKNTSWQSELSSMISASENGTIQIVTTCRFPPVLAGCTIFHEENNVNLSGDDYHLQTDEKLKMVRNHIEASNQKINVCNEADKTRPPDDEWSISQETLESVTSVNTCLGFPLLCEEFVTASVNLARGAHFFEHPIHLLTQILDKIDPLDCCTLGCVLIFRLLTKESIESMSDKVRVIARICELTSISSDQIQNSAKRMSTCFLDNRNKSFRFKHDSIKEAVFARFCPRTTLVIEGCELALLKNLRVEGLTCIVRKDQFEQVSDRLVREITEIKNIKNVVSLPVLGEASFVDSLWSYLESQPKKMADVVQSKEKGSSILYLSSKFSYGCFVERLIQAIGNEQVISEQVRTRLQIDISNVLPIACSSGNVSVYKARVQSGAIPDELCLNSYKYTVHRHSNCPDILADLAHVRYTHWDEKQLSTLLDIACDTNHYSVYKHLTKDRGVLPDGRCLFTAVRMKHSDIIVDLAGYDHWPEEKHIVLLEGACRIDNYELYKSLKDRYRVEPDRLCLEEAVDSGSRDILDDLAQYTHLWK